MNQLVVVVYAGLQGHGAIVSPRSRNSVDAFAHPPVVGVDSCQNVSGVRLQAPREIPCAGWVAGGIPRTTPTPHNPNPHNPNPHNPNPPDGEGLVTHAVHTARSHTSRTSSGCE